MSFGIGSGLAGVRGLGHVGVAIADHLGGDRVQAGDLVAGEGDVERGQVLGRPRDIVPSRPVPPNPTCSNSLLSSTSAPCFRRS